MALAKRTRLIAGIALTVLACGEQQEAFYAKYADAVQDGAVHRGWIPAYVPPSATEIVEVHNLDTNAQLLRFRAPPEVAKELASRLSNVPNGKVPSPPSYLSRPKRGLWRRGLDSAKLPEEMAVRWAHLELGRAHCVAIDMHDSVVYAWTCSE